MLSNSNTQGLRNAFDTGTTLSGMATSEHCAIGMSNALNQKYYCRYNSYTCSADAPMITTSLKDVVVDLPVVMKKYYGDSELKEHAPMSMGMPRHIDYYLICITNNSPRTVVGYPTHSNGPPILYKYIDRFSFAPAIGQKIIDWQYTPASGYIDVKAHYIPYVVDDSVIAFSHNMYSRISQRVQVSCTKEGVTSAKISINTHCANVTNEDDVMYYSIDGVKHFAPYDKPIGIHKK